MGLLYACIYYPWHILFPSTISPVGIGISPVDLVGICLDRIKKLDPKLNAFITVIEEEELYKQAQTVEEEIRCNSDRHKQSK
jgi:Asp-tRNA(Asn)/Glu-tRNA(Gln) amidotransferase A subunit family amidase